MMSSLQIEILVGLVAAILFAATLPLLGTGRQLFEHHVGLPLVARLHRGFVFVERQRLLCGSIVLSALVFGLVALLAQHLLWAVASALAIGAVPSYLVHLFELRRRLRFVLQLPDLMSLIAANLRAGASLMQAIVTLSGDLPIPIRQEFELLLREHRLGVSFDDALLGLERRMGDDETVLLCTALRVSHVSGGDLALMLDVLAAASRQRQALESRIRAATAQGRLQAWVMSALPLLIALALSLIEPDYLQPLWSSKLGLSVCIVVLVLLASGVLLLRRIIAIDV